MCRRIYCCRSLMFGLVLLLCAGCGGARSRDRREEDHPLLQRARAEMEAGRVTEARLQYEELLEKEPRLARAHLELGQLYENDQEDYVSAIYHYRRFLELRPETEKRELLEEIIRSAYQLLGASLPNPPEHAVVSARLKRENNMLRHRLSLLASAAVSTTEPVEAPPSPAPSMPVVEDVVPLPTPAPAKLAIRTYEVKRGDNLSRIAVRVYGKGSAWRKILEANKDQLESPDDLKPGQTLLIP